MEFDLPVARAVPRPSITARSGRLGKRTFDILVAGLGLLLFGPLMLLVAALVRLTSPGPVLFRQVRLAQHCRPFVMYKFRTMFVDCPDDIHREYVSRMLLDEKPEAGEKTGLYKLEADPRVTRLGAILRRTSLDELPQLINVFRGDMSIVGPRPMLPWERAMLPARHQARFAVPAGITGLWQVSGRSRLTMREALDLDLQYVRRRTLGLDVLIVLKTAWILLASRGGAR
jgi:lipopolysaccharide/colanic/teichoic acid biosynthesis glycosyltransferase